MLIANNKLLFLYRSISDNLQGKLKYFQAGKLFILSSTKNKLLNFGSASVLALDRNQPWIGWVGM